MNKKLSIVVKLIAGLVLFTVFTSIKSVSANQNPNSAASSTSSGKKVVINSQVKGEQAQPNVLYIMPWQNMTPNIQINQPKTQLVLPQLTPVYFNQLQAMSSSAKGNAQAKSDNAAQE
ncbi:hypothetical protein DS2_18528 [Catenovulum agarivorans DS-2]|uniref:Uncharacterized protein n=1 Tax=Catenovulum agarivorans DS-2 TaxID=1328313 RepID=W7Q8A0_9ALTE|nr:hypothetical protein [Catenovulum agarivorans]EWH08216.1 hypothetical protein DS2_18528 [Catenovulum agarivorans DS-2]